MLSQLRRLMSKLSTALESSCLLPGELLSALECSEPLGAEYLSSCESLYFFLFELDCSEGSRSRSPCDWPKPFNPVFSPPHSVLSLT